MARREWRAAGGGRDTTAVMTREFFDFQTQQSVPRSRGRGSWHERGAASSADCTGLDCTGLGWAGLGWAGN